MENGTCENVSIVTLRKRKKAAQKFPVLTCYDSPTASILYESGVDVLLIGDSYGQVVLGFDSTLPVTMDMMVTACAAVRRGAPHAFLIGDMPYLSYQVNKEEAVRNAGRLLIEGGCNCVKIEVNRQLIDVVEAMVRASIPVMAHLGLRPQSIQEIGGYRVQGRDAEAAMRLVEDARIMEQAGAIALLLEAVTPEPARIITQNTALPVIGCGAGPYCDGHVLVLQDMLGWLAGKAPRFAKRYGDLRTILTGAVQDYAREVRDGVYPAPEHCYEMLPEEAERLAATLQSKESKPPTGPNSSDRPHGT
jgi:3-methyl-2-oxobutanoate hydroxymethyltransferase